MLRVKEEKMDAGDCCQGLFFPECPSLPQKIQQAWCPPARHLPMGAPLAVGEHPSSVYGVQLCDLTPPSKRLMAYRTMTETHVLQDDPIESHKRDPTLVSDSWRPSGL